MIWWIVKHLPEKIWLFCLRRIHIIIIQNRSIKKIPTNSCHGLIVNCGDNWKSNKKISSLRRMIESLEDEKYLVMITCENGSNKKCLLIGKSWTNILLNSYEFDFWPAIKHTDKVIKFSSSFTFFVIRITIAVIRMQFN